MKLDRKTVAKWLAIAAIAVFVVDVVFPLFHIAFPGPLWTTSSLFFGQRLTFSFETGLDQGQITTTEFDQSKEVTFLAWSSDGRYLLVASHANTRLNVYDTQDWQLVHSILRPDSAVDEFRQFEFLPAQHILLAPLIQYYNDPTTSMQEWDVDRNKLIRNFNSDFSESFFREDHRFSRPNTIAVSIDGKFVSASVSGEEGAVLIFDSKNSTILRTIHCGGWDVPDALAFSNDGKTIVTGECHLNTISFFDTATGNLKYETSVGKPCVYNFISYSPDGKKVAIASTDAVISTVTILDSSDGHLVRVFPAVDASITNMQWLDDDTILASYDCYNPDGSSARIWDLKTGKVVEEFGQYQMALAVLDNNDDRLAIASGSFVQVFRVKNSFWR